MNRLLMVNGSWLKAHSQGEADLALGTRDPGALPPGSGPCPPPLAMSHEPWSKSHQPLTISQLISWYLMNRFIKPIKCSIINRIMPNQITRWTRPFKESTKWYKHSFKFLRKWGPGHPNGYLKNNKMRNSAIFRGNQGTEEWGDGQGL